MWNRKANNTFSIQLIILTRPGIIFSSDITRLYIILHNTTQINSEKLKTPTLMWVCSTSWNHSYNNVSQQETPLHPSCPEDHWPSLAPPNHWACYTAVGERGRDKEKESECMCMHMNDGWVPGLKLVGGKRNKARSWKRQEKGNKLEELNINRAEYP